MRNFTQLLKPLFSAMLLALFISGSYAQFKKSVFYTSEDVTIGSGTELNTAASVVSGSQLQMSNFDGNAKSYFESWVKFDLSSVADSMPDGMVILYAEIKFRTSANADEQGAVFYHLPEADDWEEDKLTWDDAQAYNFEDEANSQLIKSLDHTGVGNTSSRPVVNVTDQVKQELEQGNKILTIRIKPLITELDDVNHWLGFYSRESTWDRAAEDEFNKNCAQITITFGPEQPTQFSDLGDFGKIESYESFPEKFGVWLVGEETEGDGNNTLYLAERPAPINKTPGAVAVYKESYGDFELSVDAKSPAILDSDKSDFCIVFGYVDAKNYSYVYLIGNDDGGIYQVVDGEGSQIVEQQTPALVDDAYHTYKVSRTGNTVTVKIDDVDYISASDDALKTEGKVGVGGYNDYAYFDNIIQGTVEPAETNFDALNATITSAKEAVGAAVVGENDGEYAQAVVDALNAAITAAEAVAGNADASQADVDAADQALEDAVELFGKSANGIQKGDLSSAIDAAVAKVDAAEEGTEGGKYDEGAKAAFQTAIDAAKAVLENADATQDEVDAAVTALETAEGTFDSELNIVGIATVSTDVFKVYPNPVDDVLYISNISDIMSVSISNLIGQSMTLRQSVDSNTLKINTADLQSGIYMISMKIANGDVIVKKFIKK